MQIVYWVLAGLLAVFYLYAGGLKVTRSQDQLRPMMAWVDTMPLSKVRLIGALEIAGAVGLVLPPLTGVLPFLAACAAIGFAALQGLAVQLHVRRGETDRLWLNLTLIAAAILVAGLSAYAV